jgi:hypothetical protein
MKVLSLDDFIRQHYEVAELPTNKGLRKEWEEEYRKYLSTVPDATEGARKVIVVNPVVITFANGTKHLLSVGDEYMYDGEYIAPQVGIYPQERMIILHRTGFAPFAVNKDFVRIVPKGEGEGIGVGI